MKRVAIIALTYLTIAACSSQDTHTKKPIEAGIVIAADTMDIAEDSLNGHFFAVTVFTNDSSANGSYDVETIWGNNTAYTNIRMPLGGESFQPVIRKGSEAYSVIIGFNTEGDTTFRDYYGVTGARGSIKARYLKYYSFE
jgi:hypothetical protein